MELLPEDKRKWTSPIAEEKGEGKGGKEWVKEGGEEGGEG